MVPSTASPDLCRRMLRGWLASDTRLTFSRSDGTGAGRPATATPSTMCSGAAGVSHPGAAAHLRLANGVATASRCRSAVDTTRHPRLQRRAGRLRAGGRGGLFARVHDLRRDVRALRLTSPTTVAAPATSPGRQVRRGGPPTWCRSRRRWSGAAAPALSFCSRPCSRSRAALAADAPRRLLATEAGLSTGFAGAGYTTAGRPLRRLLLHPHPHRPGGVARLSRRPRPARPATFSTARGGESGILAAPGLDLAGWAVAGGVVVHHGFPPTRRSRRCPRCAPR